MPLRPPPGRRFEHADNAVRVGVGQRLEQHAIDEGKIAVFAPSASASVNKATSEKPGFLSKVRTAKRTS